MKKWCDALKRWHEGEYVPPPQNDPDSPVIFISVGTYKRPWLARAIDATARYIVTEYKWLVWLVLAIAALVISIAKFF